MPTDHRERVLGDAHREASSGHFGDSKTYNKSRARVLLTRRVA